MLKEGSNNVKGRKTLVIKTMSKEGSQINMVYTVYDTFFRTYTFSSLNARAHQHTQAGEELPETVNR